MAPTIDITDYIDITQPSLWVAVGSIIFNPLFWNTAARQEHANKYITKLFGGNPRYGCYGLALTIFLLGVVRDRFYTQALEHQPVSPAMLAASSQAAGVGLVAAGSVLVLTSMWALGVTGTYLGDYFGILMDRKVTSFPFNVLDAPMYVGSTVNFLGTALWYGRPAGVLLTGLVWLCYSVALAFEDPFTAEIYARRDRERRKAIKGGKKQ